MFYKNALVIALLNNSSRLFILAFVADFNLVQEVKTDAFQISAHAAL